MKSLVDEFRDHIERRTVVFQVVESHARTIRAVGFVPIDDIHGIDWNPSSSTELPAERLISGSANNNATDRTTKVQNHGLFLFSPKNLFIFLDLLFIAIYYVSNIFF